MQHFKVGGSVKTMCGGGKAMKKGGEVDAADMKQDKAVIKKAFKMHDSQEHEGEKTDLSKLKKGGRAKKEAGTVRKYKDGGSVGVYGAKKSSGDIDSIEKAKDITPKKAEAPSRASVKGKDVGAKTVGASGHKDLYVKSKESGKSADASSGAKGGPNKYKCGGGVKKMAVGGSALNDLMQAKELARLANARKYLNKGQQGQFAASEMQQTPAMTGLGQQAPAVAPQAPVGPTSSMVPSQKCGGTVKRKK